MANKVGISATIDPNVLSLAKKHRINISQAAEDALIEKINIKQQAESKVYPEEMAKLDPENFWINPEGKCLKRGEPTYLYNHMGEVRPIAKREFIRRLKNKDVL